MTIRFLRQWNGHDDQSIVSLAYLEEQRLVGLGIATIMTSSEKSDSNAVLQNSRNTTLKIATFGDSTADYGTNQSPTSNDTRTCNGTITTGALDLSLALHRCMVANVMGDAIMVQNCGVGGRGLVQQLSDEAAADGIATRRVQDAAKQSPDVISYRGASINDLYSSIIPYPIVEATYQTILANHKLVLNRLATVGCLILDCGFTGFSQGTNGNVTASNYVGATDLTGDGIRAALIRMNADIKSYIESLALKHVKYCDLQGILFDERGMHYEGMTADTDGVHDSNHGAILRGKKEAELINGYYGAGLGYVNKGTNLQTNKLFTDLTLTGDNYDATGYTWNTLTGVTRSNTKVKNLNGKNYWSATLTATATTVAVKLSMPFNPLATGTNPLNVVAGDEYALEYDWILKNTTTGKINNLIQVVSRVRYFNAAASASLYYDLKSISPGLAGHVFDGDIELHINHNIHFNESAAALGGTTQYYVDVSFNAAIGDVFEFGIANPRISKII